MIVTIKHTVERLDMSARDWQLYTSMDGVDKAAHAMTRDVRDAINAASNRDDAIMRAYEVLRRFDKYGATDTEPRGVMIDLVNKVYCSTGHED